MCLNTAYKLFTGILLMEQVMAKDLLSPEQAALRKGCRGCLDALVRAVRRKEAGKSPSHCDGDCFKGTRFHPEEGSGFRSEFHMAPMFMDNLQLYEEYKGTPEGHY